MGDLMAALESTWARGRVATLPPVNGLEPRLLSRALYRRWLAEDRPWAPLVLIDVAYLGTPEEAREVLEEAASDSGWVVLTSMPSVALPNGKGRGAWLVFGEGPALTWPEAVVATVLAEDAWHLVATDPALEDVRRSLVSHCRSASLVHLEGPLGTGKRDLVGWAHAQLDDRPLAEIAQGRDARPTAGQWSLFAEVSELDADRLHHLRVALERGRAHRHTPIDTSEGPPRPDHPALHRAVGESAVLLRALDRAARAARTTLPVLLLGETGVGKELFARAIHEVSGRKGPFHAVDVSTLNPQLVESELFGHASGAFSGADKARRGAVRSADGGTLFLDELGNVEPKIQAKLLRLLQERTVQPVGSDEVVPVDVRFVAATNADLEALVRRGEFRADLLHRLEAVTLHIPPLRERGDDVLKLATAFFAEARGPDATQGAWLSDEAAQALRNHHWPGNVRELQQVMHVAAFEVESLPVRPAHLGHLAPANRRPVPVLTTQSLGDQGRPTLALPRSLAERMTTVTLRIPALADRGAEALRHAIRTALDGHPIREDALDVLARRAWRGNLPELLADAKALSTATRRPIDRTTVARHLPHLLSTVTARPIVVLWNPTFDDGEIVGLERTFGKSALLIGRVRRLADLEAGTASDPTDRERLHDQLAEIRRLTLGDPACLAFPHQPFVSRAHVLVTLDDDGFRINVLPGVNLPAWVSPLSEPNAPVQPLGAAGTRRVGDAFELRIRADGAGPDLQLFLFAGRVARSEYGPEAVSRAGEQEMQVRAAETRVWALPARTAANLPSRPSSAWVLSAEEVEALNEVVARYETGPFSAHVRNGLERHRGDDQLGALAAYVLDVRPSQYAATLYELTANEPLRVDLAQRMKKVGRGSGWLALLPAGLQRAMEAQLGR